jgi:hypothetical protein
MFGRTAIAGACAAAFALASATLVAQGRGQAAAAPPAEPLSALAPENLSKPRPKAPFDLTGNWFVDTSSGPDAWRFGPPYPKLTPKAQKEYDTGMKLLKEGKVYKDDIGQCWPAGLPLIMTRYWPTAMIQVPTAVYMVSEFMNSFRTIFLDGRAHTDADVVVRTPNGESVGHWEGDAMVVDTRYFRGDHHWMDQGGASIPAGEQLRYRGADPAAAGRQAARDRLHDDRPGELGRRVEEHQTIQPGERHRHSRSRVSARSQRPSEEHSIQDSGSMRRR